LLPALRNAPSWLGGHGSVQMVRRYIRNLWIKNYSYRLVRGAMVAACPARSQCPLPFSAGLELPLGMARLSTGDSIVTESGSTKPNTGRIPIVNLAGRRRLLNGLPSGISDAKKAPTQCRLGAAMNNSKSARPAGTVMTRPCAVVVLAQLSQRAKRSFLFGNECERVEQKEKGTGLRRCPHRGRAQLSLKVKAQRKLELPGGPQADLVRYRRVN